MREAGGVAKGSNKLQSASCKGCLRLELSGDLIAVGCDADIYGDFVCELGSQIDVAHHQVAAGMNSQSSGWIVE